MVPVCAAPLVEQALVAAVPTAARLEQLHQLGELVVPGVEDKHARIEYIRPPDVGNSGELVWKCE